MDGGGLDPQQVAAAAGRRRPGLKETASWIVGRHPEWAGALAGFLRERLTKGDLPAAERAELERQLARFAAAPAIQALLAERLADASAPRRSGSSSLQAMARSGLKEVPGRVGRGARERAGRTAIAELIAPGRRHGPGAAR